MNVIGKKVILRAIEQEDLEMLRQLKNDPWIESMVVGWSLPISKVQQSNWYQNLSHEKNTIRFLVEIEKQGAVGYTTINDIDWKNRCAGTGTMLVKENISKGIGFDVIMTRTRYAFEELQLNRLEASILAYNEASRRTVEKAGYKLEGTKRQAVYKNGKYHDLVTYGILREEYEAKVKEINYWSD